MPKRPSLTDVMEKAPKAEETQERLAPSKLKVSEGSDRRKPGKRSLGWVQLNVQVPADVRARAKIKAIQEDTDLSEVVTRLLTEWAEKK